METAKAFGLYPSLWRQQSVDDRAMMIAHETIKAIRDAYQFEKMKKKSESKDKDKDDRRVNPWMQWRSKLMKQTA